ncbi:MAG: hypothetical protein BWY31_03877 [Lentisphaerae bacterium ADurb.Bin242]|nr:MAG: hypothetical protein BWY31_03877 [Lentisphaerae bacterium ADurb.Bin242]
MLIRKNKMPQMNKIVFTKSEKTIEKFIIISLCSLFLFFSVFATFFMVYKITSNVTLDFKNIYVFIIAILMDFLFISLIIFAIKRKFILLSQINFTEDRICLKTLDGQDISLEIHLVKYIPLNTGICLDDIATQQSYFFNFNAINIMKKNQEVSWQNNAIWQKINGETVPGMGGD